MYDSLGAAGIRAPLARRDQLLDANGNNGSFNSLTTDKLIVILDPYHNHIDNAWFEINPAGVRGDQFNGDPSWDPIWEAATHVDSLGWTAEMRIPYSQLRFSRDSLQTWGMQIWRYTDRLNEQDMWSFRRKSEAGGAMYFGSLNGLAIEPQPHQLEILPYVESRRQYKYASPSDPYHKSSYGRVSAGADMKYLLTSSLALDATVNPDFGQVEVDPATINLSAYETYYSEKRPFFVAGNSAFDFGNFSCNFCSNTSSLDIFYSRRIGRPPQLNPYVGGVADFADTPDNTTILGAAKITGRPVKWVEDRVEHLVAASSGPNRITQIEAAVTKEGRILALRLDQLEDYGAFLRMAADYERVALDTTMVFTGFFDKLAPFPAEALPLARELALMPEWFLARHLSLTPSADEAQLLDAAFEFLIREALAQPLVFVHRDYHARNLMVVRERNPGILDFQDALRGPVAYDLVSLLKDCYIAWPRERVVNWVSGHRAQLRSQGGEAGASEAQFLRWFDLIGVQRHIKVLGIFCRLWYRDGKPGYLPDLPRTLDYVRDTCARYAELTALGSFLEQRVVAPFARANARVAAQRAADGHA